jgi:hypothetical protein
MARQNGGVIPQSFIGYGPNALYISATPIIALPISALFIGLLVIIRAWVCTIRQRQWVNRVEFESWWLVKALCPEMYSKGYSNGTEDEFIGACQGFSVVYKDNKSDEDGGDLVLCPVSP